jgi:sensor domain CHASE-containing protein
MTLRQKTLLSIGFAFIALIAVLYYTSSQILLEGFSAIENESARANVQRVRSMLNADIEAVDQSLPTGPAGMTPTTSSRRATQLSRRYA